MLGLTGLHIEGGIASVGRTAVRVLDEAVEAGRVSRTDRVLLHEPRDSRISPPANGHQALAGGSKVRFGGLLWSELLRRRYDVILFDHIGLARALAVPFVRSWLPPYVSFVHGTELMGALAEKYRASLQASGSLLAVSSHTRSLAEAAAPGVAKRTRVISLCPDPQRLAMWESGSGAQHHSQGAPAAVIVGRMDSSERGKGHDEVIEAWPVVLGQVPDAVLEVIGAGDDVSRLEGKAGEMGLGESVRFLGRIDDSTLSDHYRKASVFVMPSRQEGFGLVYAEAMWHGLACIGSRSDAAKEVISEGETGLLVEYGDVGATAAALIQLLSDPELSHSLGEAGRRRVEERFNYERFRRELLDGLGL